MLCPGGRDMPLRFSFFARSFKSIAPALAVAMAIAAPGATAASERREQATFDLELRGVRAGSITFSGAANASAYSAAVRLQSSGLVSLFRRIRFDGQAQGRLVSSRPVPSRYQDSFDNGRRETAVAMEFRNGAPSAVTLTPEREPSTYDIAYAAQNGVVDIVSAVFAVFRDTPREQVCNMDLAMFDGRRRTQLLVSAPAANGNRVSCAGEYVRVAGFPPSEMAERTRFPFTLTYEPGSDGLMQLREIRMESTQGTGRLIRR